jgi:hypothetical protein
MHRYTTTTFCYGPKYTPILPLFLERIKNKCKNSEIKIHDKCNVKLKNGFSYAWWDVVRLHNNMELLMQSGKPVVHVDIDLIIEKDIEPLVNLNYDLIISKEIGYENAFPKECSNILGFGICSGFYVLKSTALAFLLKMYNSMSNQTYGTYSDQVTIMNYIVQNKYTVRDEEIIIGDITYTNKIITIDNIKICVLDFNIITRDPIINNGQFGNHINIDNVGGTANFLEYYNHDLETLPLTCRCGKTHLGDNSICPHIAIKRCHSD